MTHDLPLAAVMAEIARARAARPDLDWAAFDRCDRCAPVTAAHGRRSSFPWHLTASVFVVDADGRRTLLVEHPTLGRLLQPGGHLEPGETLRQAA
uniref:NUDIX domain-containing protein n=1 Tax=Rubrivivax gelatinosus TaxID=28068 RepID=UPI0005C248C4